MGEIRIALTVDDHGAVTKIHAVGSALGDLDKKLGQAQDRAKTLGASLASAGAGVQRFGQNLTGLGVGISAVSASMAALAGVTTSAFANFERSMTKIVTLAGGTEKQLGGMTAAVKELAVAAGRDPQELAEALFFIASSGFEGAEALDVLEQSAKASAAGLGETKVVADALTSAMAAYGPGVLDASRATDILVETVRQGKGEADAIAGSIGRVVGIASQMGVSFEQVGGFVATFTRLGVDAEEATTALRGTLTALLSPTDQQREALAQLGFTVEGLRKSISERGLTQSLIDLVQASKGNVDVLGEIIPNVRALSGVLGTAGVQAENFVQIQNAITNSTGAAAGAFERTTQTMAFSIDQLKARLEILRIEIGQALGPSLLELSKNVEPLIADVKKVIDAFNALPQSVKTSIVEFAAAGVVIGPLVVGLGLIVTSVGRVISMFGAAAGVLSKLTSSLAGAGTASATAATGIAGFATRLLGWVGIALIVVDTVKGIIEWFKLAAQVLKDGSVSWQEYFQLLAAGARTIPLIGGLLGSLIEKLGQVTAPVQEAISGFVDWGRESLALAADLAEVFGLADLARGFWDAISSGASLAFDLVSDAVDIVVAKLEHDFKLALDIARAAWELFAGAFEAIAQTVGPVIDRFIIGPITAMASAIKEKLQPAIDAAGILIDMFSDPRMARGVPESAVPKLAGAELPGLPAVPKGAAALALLQKELQGAQKELVKTGGSFDDAGKASEEFKKKIEKFTDAFTKAGAQKQAKELAAMVTAVGGAAALSGPGLEKLVGEIKELKEAGADIPLVLKSVVAEFDRLTAAARAAAHELGSKMLTTAVANNFSAIASQVNRYASEIEKSTDAFALSFAANMEIPDVVPGGLDAFQRNMVEIEKRRKEELEYERARRAAMSSSERFADDVNTGLSVAADLAFRLGDAFEQMGISAESGFGRVAASIIQTVGLMQQAAASGAQMKAGFKQGGIGGAIGMAQGAIGAAGAIGGATAHGSTGARTLKGAAAGAAAGAQFGPWGAVIGAGVGAIVGFIRGRKMAKDMDRVKDALGAKLSEAFVEAARKVRDNLKKQGFDVGIGQASLLMLDQAFEDVGGVAKFGMDKAAKAVINLQNAIKLGTLPAAEGLAQVGKAFAAMATEALKSGDVIDKATLSVIKRSQELGQKVPEIQEFVKGQLEAAAQALPSVFAGIKIATPEDAQAQATIFSTSFWGAVKEMGLLQAVEAFKPAWEAINKQLETGGFAVDLGGVGEIFALLEKPEFGPLLAGVDGLSKALAGLANSGYLTQQSFAAFQQQAMSAFNQLTAAGLSQELSLQAIAPLLQNVVAAAQAYGFEIDANTAGLIEQAKAAGIGFKTAPMERMVDVLEVIAKKLGATAEELGNVGAKAAGAAGQIGQIGSAVGSIPRVVDVEIRASRTGDWSEQSPRTEGEGGGVPGAQHGALVAPRAGGSMLNVGEGGRAEVVAPVDALFSRLADHLADRVVRPAAGEGGAGRQVFVSAPVTVKLEVSGIVTADPMEIARKIAEATRLAVRDNIGGLTSEIAQRTAS